MRAATAPNTEKAAKAIEKVFKKYLSTGMHVTVYPKELKSPVKNTSITVIWFELDHPGQETEVTGEFRLTPGPGKYASVSMDIRDSGGFEPSLTDMGLDLEEQWLPSGDPLQWEVSNMVKFQNTWMKASQRASKEFAERMTVARSFVVCVTETLRELTEIAQKNRIPNSQIDWNGDW